MPLETDGVNWRGWDLPSLVANLRLDKLLLFPGDDIALAAIPHVVLDSKKERMEEEPQQHHGRAVGTGYSNGCSVWDLASSRATAAGSCCCYCCCCQKEYQQQHLDEGEAEPSYEAEEPVADIGSTVDVFGAVWLETHPSSPRMVSLRRDRSLISHWLIAFSAARRLLPRLLLRRSVEEVSGQ